MSVKLTFLLIDIKSVYTFITRVRDKHGFCNQNLMKLGEKNDYVNFSKVFKLAPQAYHFRVVDIVP